MEVILFHLLMQALEPMCTVCLTWGFSLPFLQHFVSERKYDEDLGRVARFTCDVETLKKNIDSFGQGKRVRVPEH